MTTVLQEMPSVDEHKTVKRNSQRCRELEDKLTKVQAQRAALIAQRDQLQRDAHQAAVSRHMGDGARDVDTARLVPLDADIAKATADEHALRDALDIQQTAADGVRQQVEQERHAQIAATVRSTLTTMQSSVQELVTLNLQLQRFAEQASGVLVPFPALLQMWLDQVRGLVGDR